MLKIIILFLVLGRVSLAGESRSGLTADSLLLGQSAAFKGTFGTLGTELWRGAEAYFRYVNDNGGINGRKIEVLALDDSYDADKTLANTIRLVKEENVFALFGYVGTPTIVKALPAIQKFYSEQKIFLFSNLTGAQPQREAPHDRYTFNIRASYREETAGLVDHLRKLGHKKIGLFIQNDAYGRSGFDGVQRALAKEGLKIFAEATYPRDTRLEDSMIEQVNLLKGSDAIISISSYQASAAFIRDVRKSGYRGPIANVSFVGGQALLQELVLLNLKMTEKGENFDLRSGIIVSQVVPPWEDKSYPVVKQYLQLMEKYKPELPESLRDDNYKALKMSFGSLEGFIDAKVFVEILKKIPHDQLSRKTFMKTAEALRNFDVGLKFKIGFSATDHQAIKHIFFTAIDNSNQYVEIKNWDRFK